MKGETLDKIKKMDDDILILIIIDRNIVELSVQLLFEKGWIGFGTMERVTDVLIKEMKIKAEEWKNNLKKNIKIVDGNFVDVIEDNIEIYKPREVLFVKASGFNPYWSIIKPLLEKLRFKYDFLKTI